MSFSNYSVLMSVYAKEKPEFLRESMMSMYEQTMPTNDFVLVCDGPLNEELDEVISEMQKKFGKVLHVVRLAENHGLGYALNVGVTECKNELIARMDSDDASVRDRCEKELRVLEENPELSAVGSNIIEYDEKMQKQLGVRKVPENNAEIKKYLKKRNPMNHMTVCFKKNDVLESGNYLEMPGFEDYYLWARMIKNNCKFYNIQESLMKVRGGASMADRRGGSEYIKNVVRFQKAFRKENLISGKELISNISIRTMAAMIPNKLRAVFYVKILRSGK